MRILGAAGVSPPSHREQSARATGWALLAVLAVNVALEVLQAVVTGTLRVPPGVLAAVVGADPVAVAGLTFLLHELQGHGA